MNAERFEEWLQYILPSLRENVVIILNNAPYHSPKLNKPPTPNNRKAKLQQWLVTHNIPYEDDMVNAELLALIKQNVTSPAKYAVDEIIKASNRKVLRLLPYHCELNSIQLIRAQVKGYVARHNTSFKLEDVMQLLQQNVNNILSENWKDAMKYVINVENKMWELDNLIGCQVESLVITNDGSTTLYKVKYVSCLLHGFLNNLTTVKNKTMSSINFTLPLLLSSCVLENSVLLLTYEASGVVWWIFIDGYRPQ
ncbi:hypothetical protein MML48_3g00007507 [Holotrichia oblita]|uniref:Uncharacterized protein n=1 Tax=Holotrichia oblita TaxID=644536 RepID=A0ACB9TGU2_HOLOL|nr:hypothetical protein MML48_3g00007507 [Holotrichia oblita]